MTNSADAPRTVVIAGGGIGGLAAAIAFAQHGIASHVLERRSVYGEDGAGIQIGPNGTKILERLGVAPLLKERAVVPDRVHVRDGTSARTLARLPLGSWISERHGAPYWVMHRRDLHAALLARAAAEPCITHSMGVDVAAVSTQHGVTATARDGRSWDGEVFVAADGVWSKLRSLLFAGTPLMFTGKVAARAVVASSDVPVDLSVCEVGLWLAKGGHFVHYPVAQGRNVAIVAIFDGQRQADDWSAACAPEWVQTRAQGYCEPLRQLLAAPMTWRSWSLHALSHLPPFSRGRMALLGDAAHPVLPFLAHGGVLALEDAVVLADCLASGDGDIASRLAAYDHARRGRALKVMKASAVNGRVYHMGGMMGALRDLGLDLVPPSRIMAGYDWLYGWEIASR